MIKCVKCGKEIKYQPICPDCYNALLDKFQKMLNELKETIKEGK